ncbi:MAG TPA: hypothetical protein VNN07_19270, partial [Candidatus Tectomicrobia bacterium]|nr:hypothetical protein [Candidatus Tectomicrobia bacterium]
LGGRVTARNDEPGARRLDLSVPREAWDRLVAGLQGLGRLTVAPQPPAGDPVAVALRLQR